MLELEKELDFSINRKAELDRKFDNRLLLSRLGLAGFLTGELALIVHLTYDLGWDLMEPATYLLGLGTGILTYMIFGFTRAEFAFETHMDKLMEKRRTKLYSKNGFDLMLHERIEDTVRRLRAENGHLVKLD